MEVGGKQISCCLKNNSGDWLKNRAADWNRGSHSLIQRLVGNVKMAAPVGVNMFGVCMVLICAIFIASAFVSMGIQCFFFAVGQRFGVVVSTVLGKVVARSV